MLSFLLDKSITAFFVKEFSLICCNQVFFLWLQIDLFEVWCIWLVVTFQSTRRKPCNLSG